MIQPLEIRRNLPPTTPIIVPVPPPRIGGGVRLPFVTYEKPEPPKANPLAPQPNLQGGLGGLIPPGPIGGPPPPGGKGGPDPLGGKGGQAGKGGGNTKPFGPASSANARNALGVEPELDKAHPFVKEKARTKADLDKLGLTGKGSDRIHVDDLGLKHGGEVTRAAAGKTSLAQGADVSLNTGGVSDDFARANLSEAQYTRRTNQAERVMNAQSSDDLVGASLDGLEQSVLDKKLRLQQVRAELPQPADGKKTFVNMSWGATPTYASNQAAAKMLMAPKGSPLYEEATKALGHPPTITRPDPFGPAKLDKDEFLKIKRDVINPKLVKAMQSDEFTARMKTARGGLEDELTAGRKQGMLVFNAAGNEYGIASDAGNPALSTSTVSGVKGLINVGGVDIGKPGHEDDTVWGASSAGDITVSAPGSKIPVGITLGPPGKEQTFKSGDVDGTSFASPIAAETAYAMSAANPKLSADQIGALLSDPRASRDIAGTTRDGQGHLDQFAAVVLAKNSTLSRTQIDALRTEINVPGADVAAIKARYGLE